VVRAPDGGGHDSRSRSQPEIVRLKYSRHGPVFYTDSINHVAYTLRATSSEPGSGGYLAALRLAEVRNCHEFLDAMAYYHEPSENMVCGDVEGNIAWLTAALTPNRAGGWYGRLRSGHGTVWVGRVPQPHGAAAGTVRIID